MIFWSKFNHIKKIDSSKEEPTVNYKFLLTLQEKLLLCQRELLLYQRELQLCQPELLYQRELLYLL